MLGNTYADTLSIAGIHNRNKWNNIYSCNNYPLTQ